VNIFVTGGSRGIGRSIVLKMVSEGWNVVNNFRIALDRLERQILRSKEYEDL